MKCGVVRGVMKALFCLPVNNGRSRTMLLREVGGFRNQFCGPAQSCRGESSSYSQNWPWLQHGKNIKCIYFQIEAVVRNQLILNGLIFEFQFSILSKTA
jgi:hypothetical protein